jgi:hypothetical protein
MLTDEELKHCDKMLQDDWQKEFNYAGSFQASLMMTFQTSLMMTIERADHINLKKLETVYPNLVKAYRKGNLNA